MAKKTELGNEQAGTSTVFKVMGHNLNVNGKLKSVEEQIQITCGTLAEILEAYPERLEGGKDPLASGYSYNEGDQVLEYDVYWMVRTVNKGEVTWVECACPIPQRAFHATVQHKPSATHPHFAELEQFKRR